MHESNCTLESARNTCKQQIKMHNSLENILKKSVLMELIDYFRILKAFKMFFFFMNTVKIQNVKVLEEMRASSNSDASKTKLRGHF